ncbi:unnamed protein product [Polarella glacialis]|uniref:Cyclic nucleotide-binding domain-containing protein n=1 Tax=Polarella glacialis TaxID=89957 RepID=A0A813F8T8_POLGL|nr:unnamed protein product [Polarella glacialis]
MSGCGGIPRYARLASCQCTVATSLRRLGSRGTGANAAFLQTGTRVFSHTWSDKVGRRAFSRHATPLREPLSANCELYEDVFQQFGVSATQFGVLMGHASKCRVGAGTLVVQGGQVHEKIILVLKGTAVAYVHPAEAQEVATERVPMYQYVGRLSPEVAESEGSKLVASRGSVIGGSALVDKSITGKPYPSDVIASEPMEWVEWELQDLQRIIDAPQWRAVQASFYHLLYVELIGTLDRHRAMKIKRREKGEEKGSAPPSTRQLLSLGCFVAVPFFGFGLADNSIMLICGDMIDSHFGVVLGLTTLASAGFGNWVSDAAGLGLGDAIERQATRLGLSNGGLTAAQERMRLAKITTLSAKFIGITLGCFAGMFPLLFLTPSKTEIAKEDVEVYDAIFRQSGLSTSQFGDLMKKASRRRGKPGQVFVLGGLKHGKVTLLLRGEALAYPHLESPGTSGDHDSKPICTYLGRLEKAKSTSESLPSDNLVPSRGSIIGGSALADKSKINRVYPNTVISSTSVEWIEWSLDDLLELMEKDKAYQASFYSILYGEMKTTVKADHASQEYKHYHSLLSAVLADGVVDQKERDFLHSWRQDHSITEQDHSNILQDLGWCQDGWDRGSMDAQQRRLNVLALNSQASGAQPMTPEDACRSLEHATALIDGVLHRMRPALRDPDTIAH